MKKIRWGVLGAAKIARTKVIPAMQRAAEGEVTALASRSLDTARATASLPVPDSPRTRTVTCSSSRRVGSFA